MNFTTCYGYTCPQDMGHAVVTIATEVKVRLIVKAALRISQVDNLGGVYGTVDKQSPLGLWEEIVYL